MKTYGAWQARGFLLTQQLVALALGALLLSALATALVQQWRAFKSVSQLSVLHQTAVQAHALLQRELANINFWAGLPAQQIQVPAGWQVGGDCASALDSGSFVRAGQPFLTMAAGRQGDAGSPHCLTNVVTGSGYLQIKRLAGEHRTAPPWPTNRVLLAQQGSAGIFTLAPQNDGRWYWPYVHEVYYIAWQFLQGQRVPVLMRKRLIVNNQGQLVMDTDAILDGVEVFELELGVDQDGDALPDQFVPAGPGSAAQGAGGQSHGGLSGAGQVVMLRYWLLLRSLSIEAGYRNTQLYQLGTRSWQAPNDQFRRLLVSSSVRVLNH